jgi:triosephosphate isomerase
MRRPFIAGNWKMNLLSREAGQLVGALAPLVAGQTNVDVVVAPPYTSLAAAREAARGSRIGLAGQDLFWRAAGAYTGQISAAMLLDAGCGSVIIGHSEARGRFGVPEEGFTAEVLAHFGDSDSTVRLKTQAAVSEGLVPIVCCGETLDERRDGATDSVVQRQLGEGLRGLSAAQAAQIVVAYEPVWAIGTAETCPADEANRVCGVIREALRSAFGDAADHARILYGGSVKAANAPELLGMAEIDGALVGGASLKAEEFAAIVQAAPL